MVKHQWHQLGSYPCPYCGAPQRVAVAAAPEDEADAPEPGALFICALCGCPAQYEGDGQTRLLTADEMQVVFDDAELVRTIAAVAAASKVQQPDKEMHPELRYVPGAQPPGQTVYDLRGALLEWLQQHAIGRPPFGARWPVTLVADDEALDELTAITTGVFENVFGEVLEILRDVGPYDCVKGDAGDYHTDLQRIGRLISSLGYGIGGWIDSE
jgi:hypothetical protein